jgi:hypothetical protein
MRILKTYEELNYYGKSEKFFRDLSKNKPNYKEGDYIKFIGPDKRGLDKNEIYVVDDITLDNVGDPIMPDYYYFTRLNNGYNIYSGKLRALIDYEASIIKYNI